MAYGFIPSEYISFGFFNKTVQERKMYCSDIDMNVFGYSVNNIVEVQKVLNKATSAIKYKELLKREFVIVKDNNDYEMYKRFVNNNSVFVKKKIYSSMGQGVELVDISSKNKRDYFNELITNGTWLLEELVVQNKKMSCFNESSVNTIRCITFKTNNGVVVPYCFMRTGRNGAFVDNGGAGGLLMGVDISSGIIDTDGFDEYGEKYETHPNSGIRFKGFKIPEWNELLRICKTAAQNEDKMNYLSWDMAYSEKGWVVIEVNEVGQFIGPQIVYQNGIKKELINYYKKMPKEI